MLSGRWQRPASIREAVQMGGCALIRCMFGRVARALKETLVEHSQDS